MTRLIFHIDVNSAYLSWSAVDALQKGAEIDYRTVPSIIGGDQSRRHGVVLAKSLPAKAYGVSTGEPIVSALRKCPDLLLIPPDHKLYDRCSQAMIGLLGAYTPDLEQVSIDECYMDFTGIAHRFSSYLAAAEEIRDKIYDSFGFTVNIGISENKLLAKMASDFEKPGKIHTLFPEEIPAKMWPLPVGELFMAGKSSVRQLNKLGIRTIGELAAADPAMLEAHLKSHGRMLYEFANGRDSEPVRKEHQELKGVGNSTTLSSDVRTEADARPVLRALSDSVSSRLRKKHKLAGSICVEIKYSDFTSASHQMPLDPPSNTNDALYRHACLLFAQLWRGDPIRLLGIRTTKLTDPEDTPVQLSLFDLDYEKSEKQKKLDEALDKIRKRYGDDAVKRGSLL